MEKLGQKIYIIGAGVSGLVAAKVLEEKGYYPIILEKTDRAGGRVKTDIVEGYQLDHGFQVLLNAYPMAKKYLNFEALQLQEFLPGAVIFKKGVQKVLGDPLREFSLLWPTLFSGIGSFSDKLKIFKLNTTLKKKSLSAIFKSKETSTLNYLKSFGFSDELISDFFTPFFSGIFLEPHLETSSRMFQFVYKMFGEGLAVLPKSGIEAIPKQLLDSLTKTEIRYHITVKSITNTTIELQDDTTLTSNYTIIATESAELLPTLKTKETTWKKCDTLYFTVAKRNIPKALIGLVTDKEALINNIFFHNSLKTKQQGKEELLSVTIVKEHHLSDTDLIKRVTQELDMYCGITEAKFLKQYYIPKALPNLETVAGVLTIAEAQISPTLFRAGDYLLNSSLNAAMYSGEVAANAILAKLGNDDS